MRREADEAVFEEVDRSSLRSGVGGVRRGRIMAAARLSRSLARSLLRLSEPLLACPAVTFAPPTTASCASLVCSLAAGW